MPAETGFPRADAENDFLRVRRRQVLARLVQRLRHAPDDVNVILPLEEVLAALGRRGERQLGLQTIRLDSIVGTVDSERDFDRKFRPRALRELRLALFAASACVAVVATGGVVVLTGLGLSTGARC